MTVLRAPYGRQLRKSTAGLAPALNQPLIREFGVIAAYFFSEGGGDVLDPVGGHSGAYNGNPTRQGGPWGPVVNLDGTGDYFDCGDSDDFTITAQGFSILARINPASLPGTGRMWIAAKGAASNYEWGFAIGDGTGGTSSAIYAEQWNLGGSNIGRRNGTIAMPTNAWTSVAATYASASPSTIPDLFVEGSTDNGTSFASANTGGNGTASMQIGRRGDGSEATWNGLLDYLLLCNRQLQPFEVQAIAANPYMFLAPRRRYWFVDQPSAGPTTYNQTVSASQAQSVSLAKQANLVRALSQAQSVALQKQASLARATTQAQSASLQKQANMVRSAAQAQAVSVQKQANLVRATTQAQAASASALKVLLRTVSATQAQAVSLVKSIALTRTAAQPQSVALSKSLTLTRAVIQAQSVSMQQSVRLIRGVLQAQVASVVAVFVPPAGAVIPAAVLVVAARTRNFVVSARTRILQAIER